MLKVVFKAYNLEKENQQVWHKVLQGRCGWENTSLVVVPVCICIYTRPWHVGFPTIFSSYSQANSSAITRPTQTGWGCAPLHRPYGSFIWRLPRNVQQERTILKQHTQTELIQLFEPHMHCLAHTVPLTCNNLKGFSSNVVLCFHKVQGIARDRL